MASELKGELREEHILLTKTALQFGLACFAALIFSQTKRAHFLQILRSVQNVAHQLFQKMTAQIPSKFR
jgi:hypothetical protein